MYSFVIMIAMYVKRAALADIIITTFGLIIDSVELVIVDRRSIKAAVIFEKLSFYSNLHSFFYFNHYQFQEILLFSHVQVSVLYSSLSSSSSSVVVFHEHGSSFFEFGCANIY